MISNKSGVIASQLSGGTCVGNWFQQELPEHSQGIPSIATHARMMLGSRVGYNPEYETQIYTWVTTGTGITAAPVGVSNRNVLLHNEQFQEHLEWTAMATLHEAPRMWHVDTVTKPVMTQPVEYDAPWLLNAYLFSSIESSKAVRTVHKGVFALFRDKKWRLLERVLNEVNLGRLTPEAMVGMIRISSPAQSFVRSWAAALDKIVLELERRKVPNWERLLVGLKYKKPCD